VEHTAIPIFLIRANLPLSTWSKLSMMVSWDRVEGSSAARFNLQSHQSACPSWQVGPRLLEVPRSPHITEAAHGKEKKFTHTASAAPARLIVDWEKNLSPLALPKVASARLGAFKH
jgi:hypothetical protein